MEGTPKVAVVMGSEADLPTMKKTAEVLERFGVPFEMRVLSAHRSPEAAEGFAREADSRGIRVLIAAAGGAAHLAGVLAAHTTLPVIGVPMPTERMGGADSLLSTVQMPAGVPVACMGVGESGATNAGVLAVQILATSDGSLREALRKHKGELAERVRTQDAGVQQWLKDRRRE